jgi:hypothetical protein
MTVEAMTGEKQQWRIQRLFGNLQYESLLSSLCIENIVSMSIIMCISEENNVMYRRPASVIKAGGNTALAKSAGLLAKPERRRKRRKAWRSAEEIGALAKAAISANIGSYGEESEMKPKRKAKEEMAKI